VRSAGRLALLFLALIALVALVVIPLALAVGYIGDTFGEGWSWVAAAVVLAVVAALRVFVLDRRKS
jgi:ABC-type multidrug transport system permease subunit